MSDRGRGWLSAVETITRLLEMGMDPFNFADALLGVLAQRLPRTICGSCKESYHPTKEELDGLAYGYGEAAFAQLEIPTKRISSYTAATAVLNVIRAATEAVSVCMSSSL